MRFSGHLVASPHDATRWMIAIGLWLRLDPAANSISDGCCNWVTNVKECTDTGGTLVELQCPASPLTRQHGNCRSGGPG